MNRSLLIRIAATLAALSLVVVAGTAAAGQLPPPLGAGNQTLPAGVQVLDLVSRETSPGGPAQLPQIELTLPKGWFNYDGWGVNDGGTLIVSFWDVNKVYPTGCHWASKPMIDPGPTVDGLARVLYTRPLRHASKPKGVTIGGFHGKYLRWSVPRNMSSAHCRQGYFESWTAKGWASDRYQQGGGQVDRLWILNVDGQRLVIDAAYLGATKKERAELNRVVHSIRFLPVSSRKPASAVSATSPSGNTASVASRLRVYDVGVSDINDRGLVVGSLKRDYDGSSRGFVWRKGAWRLLGRGEWAGATRINERGQILGTSGDDGHGVLWENGKPTKLGLTSVWGLNEAGQVLGGNFLGTPGGYSPATPALWTNGIGVRSLPFAPGRSFPAMNKLGQVVGQMPDGRAAEWQDGTLTDLGPGEPIALNDHGEIVGVRGDDVIVWRGGTPTDIGPGRPVALNEHGEVIVSGPAHALLWRNGVMTDLGTLGGEWSTPTAISGSGQVVGYSADYRGRQYGFVWQNGTMTRLPSPPGYAGARTRALAINDRNQVIGDNCLLDCGFRMGPYSGNRFAVLWTLRGHRIETRLIWSEHRSGKQAGTPRTLASRSVRGNGRWIAYSTAPASDAFPGYAEWGSDVFVTSVGGPTKLVAARGKARVWNVCPAFSPNGRMLAFARTTNTGIWDGSSRSTIVVVRLGPRGPIRAGRLVLKVPAGRAHCPVWSSNSSRLGYLKYGRAVVLDLHGTRRHQADGDPTIGDFDRSVDELVSPTGDLVARRSPDGTIVSRPDGSDQRVIKDGWTAGWSPDGRKLLFWEDLVGAWPRLRAVSVDPPFASETVVDHGPINGARSRLPGYGDVSWQPIRGSRTVRVIRIRSVSSQQSASAASDRKAANSNGRGPARLRKLFSVTGSDINDRGQVVGSLTKSDDDATHGFVWRKRALRLLGRGSCQPPLLGPDRYSFWLAICGPGRVIRNTQHTYEVVLKNYGRKNFRTVKLFVLHWEPISRSSVPYPRAGYNKTFREPAAVWTLHNFKPGRTFRVNITLPFKQHNDPKGSNLIALARGLHPSVGRPETQDATKDITFVG